MTDERPVIVGLLGAENAGKSTFLAAAHSTAGDVSAPVVVEAVDARQRALLTRSWDLLHKRRIFPESTAEPVTYRFRLQVAAGESTLIEVHDHRGGVLQDTAAPHQARLLVDHLGESDALLLVIDGEVLGRWRAGDPSCSRNEVRVALKIEMLSNLLLSTGNARLDRGKPFPRVIVLVTKADEYDRLTGGVDIDQTIACLHEVFPLAFDPSALTLVCVMGVGDGRSTVRGHLAPFAFAVMERLAAERLALSTAIGRLANKPADHRRPEDREVRKRMQNRFFEIRPQTELLADELAPWPVMQGMRRVPVRTLTGGRGPLLGHG